MSIRNPIVSAAATMSLLFLTSASSALAQAQSTAQQKCLNAINKDGTLVAKAQGKANVNCLKGAGKGMLTGTAQACLTADPKAKVQTKKDKTTADQTKFCALAPGFGFTGAASVNNGAVQAELDVVSDIFGPNLDPAVISCSSSKAGCLCQQKVLGDVEKLADKKLLEFLKCKKATLKAGASSVGALRDCVNDDGTPGSIAADTKGMLAKAVKAVNGDIAKKCDMP